MPTYVYKYHDSPNEPAFELVHSATVVPLQVHPTNGRALQRVFTPVGLTLRTGRARSLATEQNLTKNGFQQYRKQRDGTYVRTAGNQGPKTLKLR